MERGILRQQKHKRGWGEGWNLSGQMEIRWCQQKKDYFICKTFYINLMVTICYKSRAEIWNKKEETEKDIMQNQQTKMADRSTRKRKYRAARKERMLVLCSVTQSCPTPCDPTDWSPLGSSVWGILQARILEWVAIFHFSIITLNVNDRNSPNTHDGWME